MKIADSIKLLAIVVLGTTIMSAQASRTWVSGVGDDANPCSRTAPCKTWAGAISKTAPGGEIDALDPGGFGAVTITKAITLDGGGGQVASVLVSGTNGIVVQAGAGDVVIIRNLRINGIGSGLNGIQFNSGKDLNIENCFIFGFTQNGINITTGGGSSVHIVNTIVKNITGVGIRATSSVAPPVQVGIDDSKVMVTGTAGIEAAQHSRVVVNRSFVEHGGTDGIKADDAATSDAQMYINSSESDYSTNGITAATGSTVVVGSVSAAYNATCGFNSSAGGSIFGFNQTNRVIGTANCGTVQPDPQLP